VGILMLSTRFFYVRILRMFVGGVLMCVLVTGSILDHITLI